MKRTFLIHPAVSVVFILGMGMSGAQPLLTIQSGVELRRPTATNHNRQPFAVSQRSVGG